MERYLTAAQKISRTAVGLPPSSPNIDYFRVADDRAQDDRLSAQLFGTRGGASIRLHVPDGCALHHSRGAVAGSERAGADLCRATAPGSEHRWRARQRLHAAWCRRATSTTTVRASSGDRRTRGRSTPSRIRRQQPAVRRVRRSAAQEPGRRGGGAGGGNRQGQAQRNRADREWEIRVPVKAGPHQVQVAFVKQTSAVAETTRVPFQRPYPAGVNIAETRTGAYLRSVEIAGPFDPTGPGNSPSRQRIFTCQPSPTANTSTPKGQLPTPKSAAALPRNRDADICARSILSTLARRAYRRPVTSADIEPLMAFYRDGVRRRGALTKAIDQALQRLLISPEFLLRVEADPAGVPANTPYRDQRPRARITTVVLPVEQHPRR